MSDTATLYLIRRAVCAHYKITNADLVGRSAVRSIAWPRQVAMMLAREMTTLSYPQIARRFGNRDHTTVIHGIRAVRQRMAKNPHYAEQVEEIRAYVTSTQGEVGSEDIMTVFAALRGVERFCRALSWRVPVIQYRYGAARLPHEMRAG